MNVHTEPWASKYAVDDLVQLTHLGVGTYTAKDIGKGGSTPLSQFEANIPNITQQMYIKKTSDIWKGHKW